GLAGKGHLVLRRGELFGELHHVLVGLEIRISLGHGHQPTECPTELLVGAGEVLDCGGISGVRGGGLQPFIRDVARLDDRLERLAFVLYVSLGRLHQIRDQVVTTGELHVDLRKRVLERVARRDQAVVGRNEDDDGCDDDQQNYPAHETPDEWWTSLDATPQRALNSGLEEVGSGLARPHVDPPCKATGNADYVNGGRRLPVGRNPRCGRP